ncbi:MAG: helix-turn-helix domain-containing protein [Solirubrobacterales bacterium]
MTSTGKLLRQVRNRHGLSQSRLATRASLSRSTISKIECGRVSPSIEMLRELLFLMGEDLVIEAKPWEPKVDREQLRTRLEMTPTERIETVLGPL